MKFHSLVWIISFGGVGVRGRSLNVPSVLDGWFERVKWRLMRDIAGEL